MQEINVINSRETVFHRQVILLELNFFVIKKKCSRWSNQAGKISLTAGQFAQCLDLNETPANVL